MKDIFLKAKTKMRIGLTLFRNLLVWMCPFVLFLIGLLLIIFILKGDFNKYITLTEKLIWPFTILVGLFFFRKVFTYLVLSIDGFNLFGIEGTLKNANDVIQEQVDKKIQQIKKEEEDQQKMANLEEQINRHGVSENELRNLANTIMQGWNETKKQDSKVITELTDEIKRLKDAALASPSYSPVATQHSGDLGSGEQVTEAPSVSPDKANE